MTTDATTAPANSMRIRSPRLELTTGNVLPNLTYVAGEHSVGPVKPVDQIRRETAWTVSMHCLEMDRATDQTPRVKLVEHIRAGL